MKSSFSQHLKSFLDGLVSSSGNGWKSARGFLISQLKGEFIKIALKKVLGSSMAGGLRGWIVKYVAEYLFEEIAEPIIKLALRKGRYHYEVINGKILIKALDEAEQGGSDEDYNDAVNDIFK